MCVTNFTRFVSPVSTNADLQNKAVAAAWFSFITLQALMKMDEFASQGSSHPVFVAFTQEFLMQIMASKGSLNSRSSDVDVSELKAALAQEVRDRCSECAEFKRKLTNKHNTQSSKLDRVIKPTSSRLRYPPITGEIMMSRNEWVILSLVGR